MPAIIQSTLNGVSPVIGLSRNDAQSGDVVILTSVGVATTWSWFLPFKPQNVDRTNSAAVLAGVVTGPGPIQFTIDNSGSYLVGLITDLNLPSESRQYIRVRSLTEFGQLSLVAADERRDDTKNPPAIPVDADATGWANDQNYNLNKLLALIEHTAASGRVIFVDANRGKLNSTTPDTTTRGFADFSTISDAITAAVSDSDYNGGVPPTIDSPILVYVRPGLYEENLSTVPFVHIVADSTGSVYGNTTKGDRSVTVRNLTAGLLTHVLGAPLLTDYTVLRGVDFVCSKATTNAVFRKTGLGSAFLVDCRISQENNSITQGACMAVDQGGLVLDDCVLIQENLNPDRLVLEVNPAAINSASVQVRGSSLTGPSVALLNTLLSPSVSVTFSLCKLLQRGVNPTSFGISGTATSLVLERTELVSENGAVSAIFVNPTAAGHPGDVFLGLYWSRLGAAAGVRNGISFDTTGIVGTKILEAGASEYSKAISIGVLSEIATVSPRSVFYDGVAAGLLAANVQDAIDEVVALTKVKSFSRTIAVPTVGVPPLTYSEFFLVPESFTSTSVYVWLSTSFGGTGFFDVTLDVLVREDVVNPGVFASVMGGPNSIGLQTTDATNILAFDLGLKAGPVMVEFRVEYLVIPAAGENLVVTFLTE